MERRPDFFIVGAPKCGTTAMADYLGQHPQVAMCRLKEAHYFGADIRESIAAVGEREPWGEREYLALFPPPRGERRVGEASVWYLYSREAPVEIAGFSPGADVVVMLRDPVEMVHSLHSQLVYLGAESEPDFAAALALDAPREAGAAPRPPGFPPGSYRAAGRCAAHLERYLEAFGRERVHVALFDDFRARPLAEYRRLCEFLGVDAGFEPRTPVVNPNKRARSGLARRLTRRPPPALRRTVRALTTQPLRAAAAARLNRLNTRREQRSPMPPQLRHQLADEFAPEVRRLSELLGVDLAARWSGAAHPAERGSASPFA